FEQRRERPASASATTRRTFCADAAVAALSTSRRRPAPTAVTQAQHQEVQLGREGQEEKDHRLWPHQVSQARPAQVQERLPEGNSQGRPWSSQPVNASPSLSTNHDNCLFGDTKMERDAACSA
ncbi:hypothetical protein Tdes44962_MAKER02086, partial [Teratosphaeria destructans]